MGRRRTFIESEAIGSATAVFAERGFAGTSVDDLVRATGVNRASLYGVFGSKDGLFQRCLTEAQAALSHEPKGWRGPGLQAGSKLSGTFHAEGTAQFWNISGYENTLVITLEEERFTHLYLTIDDPAGLAAKINAAIRPTQA